MFAIIALIMFVVAAVLAFIANSVWVTVLLLAGLACLAFHESGYANR